LLMQANNRSMDRIGKMPPSQQFAGMVQGPPLNDHLLVATRACQGLARRSNGSRAEMRLTGLPPNP
jgi:hypothetical protein